MITFSRLAVSNVWTVLDDSRPIGELYPVEKVENVWLFESDADSIGMQITAHDEEEAKTILVRRLSKLPSQIEPESDLDIEELPERIEKLRVGWLLDHDASYLDPEAEQLYLLALGALEQAERFAKLAVYKTRQARSGAR